MPIRLEVVQEKVETLRTENDLLEAELEDSGVDRALDQHGDPAVAQTDFLQSDCLEPAVKDRHGGLNAPSRGL